MSDLLAIIEPNDRNEDLLDEIVRYRPDRVTVLVDGGEQGWGSEESETADATRARLAMILTAIELRTGASVIGLAGDRDQLEGWRFDRIVGGQVPVAA
jgi:hypothetical protein